MKRLFAVILLSILAHAQATLKGGVALSGGVTIGVSSGGGGGGTNVNLSGTNQTFSMGSAEVGALTAPITLTVTNNTGSPFSWASYALPTGSAIQAWSSSVTYSSGMPVKFSGNFYQSAQGGNLNNLPPNATWWTPITASAPGTWNSVGFDGDAMARVWGDGCGTYPGGFADIWTPNKITLAANATCNENVYLRPTVAGASSGHVYFFDNAGNILSTLTLNGTGVEVPFNHSATLPTGINSDLSGTVLNTHYTAPSSCTVTATTATQLSNDLAAATCGETICVQAGNTFTGNFTIPKINGCSTYTNLITTAYASLPAAGTRVQHSDATNMGTLNTTDGSTVLQFAHGAAYWRLTGLEIKHDNVPNGVGNFSVVQLADPLLCCSPQSASYLPDHVIFDRDYVHDISPLNGEAGGIILDCTNCGIIDSDIEIDNQANETQAISICVGLGPLKIVNDYIVAPGENFFVGGCDTSIMGTTNSDIEFRSNYSIKPLTWNPNCTGMSNPCGATVWDGITRDTRNNFELKKGTRVLLTSSIISQNWYPGQQLGPLIVIDPGDQLGSDLLAGTNNITLAYNLIQHGEICSNNTGMSFNWPGTGTRHIWFHDNICVDIGTTQWGGVGGGMMASGPLHSAPNNFIPPTVSTYANQRNGMPEKDFTFDHNTVPDSPYLIMQKSGNGIDADGIELKGNIINHGQYGLSLATIGDSPAALSGVWTNASFGAAGSNVLIAVPGGLTGAYSSSWSQAANIAAVGFVNYPTDLRLCTGVNTPAAPCSGASPYISGPDGKPLGADAATIYNLTACVTTGAACNPLP